jgi:hypothetical protein
MEQETTKRANISMDVLVKKKTSPGAKKTVL